MTPRLARLLPVLALALSPLFSATAFAGCESDTPARPVPQFDPNLAPGVSLWPLDPGSGDVMLKPAEVPLEVTRSQVNSFTIPAERDSTSYTSLSFPSTVFGHELFQDVAAPGRGIESAPEAEFVVAAYNSGLSVWDMRTTPEVPPRRAIADGFPPPVGLGDWAAFPTFGEDDYFVFAIDAIRDGNFIYIAVSGSAGVGLAIWTFNTSNFQLTQNYQDPFNVESYDVSLVQDPNGRFYAFAADENTGDGGVLVYDVTTATSGPLCVEPSGSYACPGVYEGKVGNISPAEFVSAYVINGETYVAASDGTKQNGPLALEIWEVGNPENPEATPTGASVRRFSGLGTEVHSPQLFTYDGDHYIAFVECVGVCAAFPPTNPDQLRIHQINDCVDGNGCSSLGTPKATETIRNSLAIRQFVDVSFSNGSPFLHYGMQTNGLFDSGFERLYDLGQLPAAASPNNLPEVTDTGGSYIDPCSGDSVDYFGDYYENNDYGLKNFNPRHAIFTGGNIMVRAAQGVLDIHVRGGEQQNNDPSIMPGLQSGGSINMNTWWMDESVVLEAAVMNCDPGGVDWCWDATVSNPNVADFPVPANPNGCDPTFDDVHTMTFLCQASGRCADTSVTVAAWNQSATCLETGLDPQEVDFNLKDPEVDALVLNSGGTNFPECQLVSLSADVEGRGGVEWDWLVNGESISGCSGVIASGEDLSAESFACDWDTTGLAFDLIFGDGFEDGTCDAWDIGCPATFKSGVVRRPKAERRGSLALKAGGTVNVEFEVSEVAGPVLDTLSQSITFNPVGDPAFAGPLPAPVVNGAGALLEAPATDTTIWTWEIEDPDSPGAPCSFDTEKNCVTQETAVDNIEYLWQNGGTYTYEVSLSNCSSAGTVSASSSVTVSNAAPPVIVDFDVALSSLQTAGNPGAPCFRDVLGNCGLAGTVYCPTGVVIDFDVEVAEEGEFTFLFDWERADPEETANFAQQSPESVSGVDYVFSKLFGAGTPSPDYPIVQILFGNERPLDHGLEFGSCP